MGRVYCCATDCHNTTGSIVEGKKVSLHRFPADQQLRKVWKSRVSRKNFVVTKNTRLCSAHFKNSKKTADVDLPTFFAHRTYKIHKFGQGVLDEVKGLKATEDKPEYSDSESDQNLPAEHIPATASSLSTSVVMHDYCGPVELDTVSKQVNKDSQASVQTSDSASQTTDMYCYKCPCVCNVLNPNNVILSNDFSVQHTSPEVVIEDLDDESVRFYTGLPSRDVFYLVYDLVKFSNCNEDKRYTRSSKLRGVDEVLMVLMRLRQGCLLTDLAKRFKVSAQYVSKRFIMWINRMEKKLSFLCEWPSRETCDNRMPACFNNFHNVRAILDCTEIFTETPTSLKSKAAIYSDYKSHMTFKALVAISPFGTISFVSDLYGGNTSDKEMVALSGILDLFNPFDSIMTDKGFLINEECLKRKLFLIIPPRKSKRKFSTNEVFQTRRIANTRIHVERAMERIKKFQNITRRYATQHVKFCNLHFSPLCIPMQSPRTFNFSGVKFEYKM